MKISTIVYRNIVFPFIFFVKRLDVKYKMAVLTNLDDRSFADVYGVQQQKYLKLFKAARTNSKYYKSIVDSIIDFKPDIASISNFPILTKEIVKSNKAHSLTTNQKNCITRMTAGTTGTPVTVFVDRDTVSWQLATRYFLFGWHGIRIGDREARFWGRPLQGIGFKLKDLLLNRKRFSFCGSTKNELIFEYSKLLDFKPDYFYGYSSLILNAAIICEENSLEVPELKAIICTAELLGQHQRKFIERVFRCPVVVEYGCSESDIIAFECKYGKLHVMSHNILIEPNPNASGMVYTDLNNTAMPLIRYELGDNVEIETNSSCECNRNLPIISHLEGRTIGQILTLPDGTTMHAVKFAYLIEDVANKGCDVIQFKIVCENNELVFCFNINGNTEAFEKEMRHGIDRILNGKMAYSFEYGLIKSEMNSKFSYFENRM